MDFQSQKQMFLLKSGYDLDITLKLDLEIKFKETI